MRCLALLFLLGCSGAPFEIGVDTLGGASIDDAASDGSGEASTITQRDGGPIEDALGEASALDAPGAPDADAAADAPELFPDAANEPPCLYEEHTNGLGGIWVDCVPVSTYNVAEAKAACQSSGAGTCTDMVNQNLGQPGGPSRFVCGVLSSDQRCYCWGYEGPGWGHVGVSGACGVEPGTNDPIWR